MVRKHKAVRIGEHGVLTDEKGEPIVCPVRGSNCTIRCAWFSRQDKILHCRDTIIGALRGKPMRSFRLYTGPEVYNIDESLIEYELPDAAHGGT